MPWAARATVRRVMESWLWRLAAASARAAAAALAVAWASATVFSVSPSVLSAVASMAPIWDCRLRVGGVGGGLGRGQFVRVQQGDQVAGLHVLALRHRQPLDPAE